MISYKECCDIVGYDKKWNPPVATPKWVGYKDGKVFDCVDGEDARKRFRNYEMVTSDADKKALEDYKKNQKKLEGAASTLFHDKLRAEYDYLSDAIFNLCYSEAYDKGHAYGYDEVASCMDSVVDFADGIINATLKSN